jgi:hypothetical protein
MDETKPGTPFDMIDTQAVFGGSDPLGLVNKRVGNCQLTSVLGTGGMGVVYNARHLQLDKDVVVKVLHTPQGPPEGRDQERFKREAKVAAQLRACCTNPSAVSP